ncbi:kinase [Streptomyces sp. NPDC049910]|uniref:GHMP family kinase ATP-binding protein n=1 Tax=Streptomyces sp. NPDC049910 TaxID=3155278 RepID=UPI003435507E
MTPSSRRVGVASSPVHHGEILQGVFHHGDGLSRGLVTLPCAMYSVAAKFTPAGPDDDAGLTVWPSWKSKARHAAELTLTGARLPVRGHLELSGDVPPRRGFGSSTSDVLAAIGAVKDAFALPLPAEQVARLAVQAETASDSLMFVSSAVLFAHREGVVIEDFEHPLPPVRVLGFGCRPEDGSRGTDTLALPPARYTAAEIQQFTRLRKMLRDAVLAKDVGLLGKVATASTRINQRHLPIPALARILAIVEEVGAVGLQTAHSGDIAGVIFDRDDPAVDTYTERAQQMLGDIGILEQWKFTTDD